MTKYKFIKRFSVSCRNYKRKFNIAKTNEAQINLSGESRSIFNEIYFNREEGVWKGYCYIFLLKDSPNRQPILFQASIEMQSLRFWLESQENAKNSLENMFFLIKPEDLSFDNNGDAIYPISYFLNNIWEFFSKCPKEKQFSSFLAANQIISSVREYFPSNSDLDKYCIILHAIG